MAKVEEVNSKIPKVSKDTLKEVYANPKVEPKKSYAMTAFGELSIRDIVLRANEEGIKRENIVSLLKENGQYILVYYK